MNKLGTPVTSRIHISRFELRVGPLSQAGILLPSHSMGILDKVDLNFAKNTMSRKAGFPQDIVASEITEQTMTVTATCGESSKRNIKLLANTGLADYDVLSNDVSQVDTTVDILPGEDVLLMSNSGVGSNLYTATQRLTGATDAKTIADNAAAVTGADDSFVANILTAVSDVISRAGTYPVNYTGGLTEAKMLVTLAAAATSADDNYVYTVTHAASALMASVPVTTHTAASTFRTSAGLITGVAITGAADLAALRTAIGALATTASSGVLAIRTFGLAVVDAAVTTTITVAQANDIFAKALALIDKMVLYTETTGSVTVISRRTAYKQGFDNMDVVVLRGKAKTGTAAMISTLTSNTLTFRGKTNDPYAAGFESGAAAASSAVSGTATAADVQAVVDSTVASLTAALALEGVTLNVPYVVYDVNDPGNLSVVEFSSAAPSESGASVYACVISDPSKFVSTFVAGSVVRMYKPSVLSGGNDAAVNYFSLRMLQLDAKTKQPRVYDFWKASINDSTTLSINNTDFTNFDIAFTVIRPVPQDYLLSTSDLYHQRDATMAAPMYRILEMVDI